MFNPGPLSIAAAQSLNDLERAVESLKRGSISGSFGRITGPEGQAVYLPPSTDSGSVWVKVTSVTATSGFYPAVLATPLDTTGGTFTDTSDVVSVGFPNSFMPTLDAYYEATLIDGMKYEGIPAVGASQKIVTGVCVGPPQDSLAASLLFAADPPSPPSSPIPIGQNYGVVSPYTAGEVLTDPTDVIRGYPGTYYTNPLYQYTGSLPHTCGSTLGSGSDQVTSGEWVLYTNPTLAAITQIIVQKQSAGVGSLGAPYCTTNPYGLCCMSDHFRPIERCNRLGYPECKCIACELKYNREKMREKDDLSNDGLQGVVEFLLLVATGIFGIRGIS